jgi:cysteine synthase A
MTSFSLDSSVGHTPLIRIQTLSDFTGCEILGKAEFLNPGGSVKDRAALGMILAAEEQGLLRSGFSLVEGTAGNTGIGLATYAAARGYRSVLFLPNNQAQEKYETLRALGAELHLVPPVPFANENHFYHQARRWSENHRDSFWVNQFENVANYESHLRTTGPEIWEQTQGRVSAFLAAVGTGGTFAGVSQFLKSKNSKIRTILVDPYGSGLYSHFTTGEMKTEGSSITEGIGIMRLTANYKAALVDEALRVSDQEMISTLYHLAQKEGLLVGTSAALNVFGAFQYAMTRRGSGDVIVTVLCDSALRYQSKVFNPEFLRQKNLSPSALLP